MLGGALCEPLPGAVAEHVASCYIPAAFPEAVFLPGHGEAQAWQLFAGPGRVDAFTRFFCTLAADLAPLSPASPPGVPPEGAHAAGPASPGPDLLSPP